MKLAAAVITAAAIVALLLSLDATLRERHEATQSARAQLLGAL